MNKIVPFFCALAVTWSGASYAGVMFYNSTATFDPAVAGLVALGGEDFESSTLGANMITPVNDSLAPGVANGVFPTGTNLALGMTVQSNTNGSNGLSPLPRGNAGMSTASAPLAGTPDDQLGNNFPSDSLDLIFGPPPAEAILAVDLIALFVDSINTTTPLSGIISVMVFNSANTLLGSTDVTADYINEIGYLGIVATGLDDIGRINLYDGDATNHFGGVDDIRVFSAQPDPGPTPTPAPGTLLLLLIGLAGLGARQRAR